MLVEGIERVQFGRLRAIFPHQVKAPFGYTDYIGEYAASAFPRVDPSSGRIVSGNDITSEGGNAQANMEFDALLRVIHPRALFVLHDQVTDEDGYNYGYEGDYQPGFGPNGNYAMAWWGLETDQLPSATFFGPVSREPGYTALSITFGEDPLYTGRFVMAGYLPERRCQGFTALMRIKAATESSPYDPHASMRWRVTGSNTGRARWYAIYYYPAGGIRFGYNDVLRPDGFPDEDYWAWAEQPKSGAGRAELLSPRQAPPTPPGSEPPETPGTAPEPEAQVFEVRLLAGQMRVSLGSEDTPMLWPHPDADDEGTPEWLIDRWQAAGNDVHSVEWSVHPTKFMTEAATISQEVNVGQVPDEAQLAQIQYRIHYAPNSGAAQLAADAAEIGWRPDDTVAAVETWDLNGTLLRYRIYMANEPAGYYRTLFFSDVTAAVRAVSLDIPGRVFQLTTPPVVLGTSGAPPKPSRIDVYHSFNLETLSISSRAEMVFDNFRGLWTNGFGTGILDTTGHFAVAIDIGVFAYQVLFREFTGIGNVEFTNSWQGGGRDEVLVSCEDCWAMLDVPVWNLPWFDGWNVYAVMAYLAALGGITRSQLLFADLVPENPYAPSPGLPAEEQFFLPVGPAGAPLTRFGGGQKLREIMLKISVSIGHVLFFNVSGGLNFYKFRIAPPTVFTRTFRHVPGDALLGGPGLDEIFGGVYRGSMKEVRNSVTVIGVNALGPLWDPIVAHDIDLDSIFNDGAANYKGWHDPVVWADNLFANKDFAFRAASSMLAYLRIPGREVQFRTWYPGRSTVYPGDLIRVQYPRSGASLYSFFVTQTHVQHHKGELPTMDISARLVPTL